MEYRLTQPINIDARRFLQETIESNFTVRSLKITDSFIALAVDDSITEAALEETVDKLIYISQSVRKRQIFDTKIRSNPNQGDPMGCLLNGGGAKKIGDGIFMFEGIYLDIMNRVNDLVRDVALTKYEAVEQEYPTLWPMEIFRKTNYLREFPQHAILTTTVKQDYAERQKFAASYGSEHEYASVRVSDFMEDCKYGLEPSVCTTCYYALTQQTMKKNTVYTTCNKVFRNESSKTGSTDRLMCFTVRDIMFVGDANFVLNTRQQLIEYLGELMNTLHLDCQIEMGNDPFFSSDVTKKLFQDAFELKYEILAKIPHTSDRLAVGSINLHQDHFGDIFNIKTTDGETAVSGCIGVGFERVAYAIYCQHGVQVSTWPQELRETIGLC